MLTIHNSEIDIHYPEYVFNLTLPSNFIPVKQDMLAKLELGDVYFAVPQDEKVVINSEGEVFFHRTVNQYYAATILSQSQPLMLNLLYDINSYDMKAEYDQYLKLPVENIKSYAKIFEIKDDTVVIETNHDAKTLYFHLELQFPLDNGNNFAIAYGLKLDHNITEEEVYDKYYQEALDILLSH